MKSEFLVERQGKRFVLYAGLLDEAHQQGLTSIRTQLLQIPSQENDHTAICFAEVITEKGAFTGIGDASPGNVSRMMAPHLIRMAETRAKARALRDALNIGAVALEELGDAEEAAEQVERHVRPAEAARPVEPARPAEPTRMTEARPASYGSPEASRSRAQPGRSAPSTPASAGRPELPPQPSGAMIAPNQLNAIRRIGRDKNGMTDEQIDALALQHYGATLTSLSEAQAADFIRQLQSGKLHQAEPAAPAASGGADRARS